MTLETQAYSSGDWIVHRHHGVGRIKGTEDIDIGGRKGTYCKIQARDSIFWLPVEKLNDEWLRPLASPAEIKQALKVLRHSPRIMESNPTERKSQIKKVRPNNSPVAIAEILRDLAAHNKEKNQVSQTDLEALRYFTRLFLAEWSTSMNLELGIVKQRLNDLLAKAQPLPSQETIGASPA